MYCRLVVEDGVYPPLEDSWLTSTVLRAIVMVGRFSGVVRVVDVGCGCGLQVIEALMALRSRGLAAWGLACDVDLRACLNTLKNARLCGLDEFLDVVCSVSLRWVRRGFGPDIVVSNPPYLVGDWRVDWRIFGGWDGRMVVDEVISWSLNFKPRYIVITQSSESRWDVTIDKVSGHYIVISMAHRHVFFEDIVSIGLELRGQPLRGQCY